MKINKQDVIRLMQLLELHKLQASHLEIRSFSDFSPEIARARVAGVPADSHLTGLDVQINPTLSEGSLRIFPDYKFRLCGLFCEWNVEERGHVPSSVKIAGRWIQDPESRSVNFV